MKPNGRTGEGWAGTTEAMLARGSRGASQMFRLPLGHGRVVLLGAACLLGLMPSQSASAQVAPVGGDHIGAYGAGPSATGSHSETVPLALPPTRKGLPIPLRVNYSGSPRAGDAGVGWDIPLSYVHESRSISRRKPALDGNGSPARLTLAIGGASMLMIPGAEPDHFLPLAGSRSLELVKRKSSYEAYDASGNTYVFTAAGQVHESLANRVGLFLLSEIIDATGTDGLEISYQVNAGGCHEGMPELLVDRIQYSPHATTGAWLYQIDLEYEPWFEDDCDKGDPVDRVLLDVVVDSGALHGRSRVLTSVDVRTRAASSPSAGLVTLREYTFGYREDHDTGAPRLAEVTLYGEGGSGAGAGITVAEYGYGYASSGGGIKIQGNEWTIARHPLGGDQDQSLNTSKSTTTEILEEVGYPYNETKPVFEVETIRTTQVLRDFTGDGIADRAFERAGKLYISPNYTDRAGTTLSTPAYELAIDADLSVETLRRPTYYTQLLDLESEEVAQTTEVWTTLIDWNADGRLDIVDARAGVDEDHWLLYLNTPVANAEYEIQWVERQIYVGRIKDYLAAQGFSFGPSYLPDSGRLPISRTKVSENIGPVKCKTHEWVGWAWQELNQSCALDQGEVEGILGDLTIKGNGAAHESIAEWKVLDVNGDGYPDFVSNDTPLRKSQGLSREAGQSPGDCDYFRRQEYLSDGKVDENWHHDELEPLSEGLARGELRTPYCVDRARLDFRYPTGEQSATGQYLESSNTVVAFHNRGGAMFPGATGAPNEGDVFAELAKPLVGSGASDCGVERWQSGPDFDSYTDSWDGEVFPEYATVGNSWMQCGFMDWNGDGIADRIGDSGGIGSGELVSRTASKTGRNLIRFENNRHSACTSGGSMYFQTRQVAGLLDVTGDGLPDRVYEADGGGWEARPGTGIGFGPPLSLDGGFELSRSSGWCSHDSWATDAAIDMNGDGRPEHVRVAGDNLRARSIVGASGDLGAPDAGRLISVGNGYGARQVIEWTSAKRELRARRDLPRPEIVVSSVHVEVDNGQGESTAPVRFAYGDAYLRYDPIMHSWGFSGYTRRVTMAGTDEGPKDSAYVRGVVTIADAYISQDYDLGFEDLLRHGTVTDTYSLEGGFEPDPWKYIRAEPDTDPQLRGGAENTYEVTAILEPPSMSSWIEECTDADPYTNVWITESYALCGTSGVPYLKYTKSWRGSRAPPAWENVQVATEVTEVDELGRPLQIKHHNDTRVDDDDICIDYEYAAPTASSHVYDAIATRRVTNCGWHGGLVYAGERLAYDGAGPGTVDLGLVSRRSVELYDSQSGQLLDNYVAAEIYYDGNSYANPSLIERTRSQGSVTAVAKHSTEIEYDGFGIMATRTTESASDAPDLVYESSGWILPSVPMVATGPNGVASTVERDWLGRGVRDLIRNGTGEFVVSEAVYSDIPGARSASYRAYPDFTDRQTAEDSPAAFTHITHFDALGRTSFTESLLGADYQNARLISGFVERDGLGRTVFAADDFEWSGDGDESFDPYSFSEPVYGTSAEYSAGGEVSAAYRGYGQQQYEFWTDPDEELLVSRYLRSYQSGRRVVEAMGPNERHTAHVAFSARDRAEFTAIGNLVEQRREQNDQVLQRTRYQYDRLGNTVRVKRFAEPQSAADAVLWSATFDSLGQRRSLSEDGVSTSYFKYDEWGGLYESRWADGANLRVSRAHFDGHGRLIDRVLVKQPEIGNATLEAHSSYFYDVHSGSEFQPAGPLLGHLSHTQQDDVMETFYGYDGFGRSESATRVSLSDPLGRAFITRQSLDAIGRPRELGFSAPSVEDTVHYRYDSAHRMTQVEWDNGAGGGEVMFDALEIDSLGRYRSVLLGNGVREQYEFQDGGRRLFESKRVHTHESDRMHAYVAYDAEGRLVKETESVSAYGSPYKVLPTTRAYTYDALDRLVAMKGTNQASYSYDALGNLRALAEQDSPAIGFEFNTVDRDRVSRHYEGSKIQDYAYDGAGSVVSVTETLPIYTWGTTRPSFGTSTSFTYDSVSRPTSVRRTSGWSTTTASMKWDAGGSLAEVEVRDGDSAAAPPTFSERRYGSILSERYVANTDGHQIVRAIPGPIGVIAQLRTSEADKSAKGIGEAKTEVLYQHGDQRGARLVTDESGAEAQVLDYAAYGRVSTDTGTAGSFDYTATQWNHGTTLTDLGLVQLGPRLYQPTTGRFLQRDPIVHIGGASASNPYSFAFDDPVNFSDPSGLSPVTLCISNGPTGTGNCSFSGRAWVSGTGSGAGGMWDQLGLLVGLNGAITVMNYLSQSETNYASFGPNPALAPQNDLIPLHVDSTHCGGRLDCIGLMSNGETSSVVGFDLTDYERRLQAAGSGYRVIVDPSSHSIFGYKVNEGHSTRTRDRNGKELASWLHEQPGLERPGLTPLDFAGMGAGVVRNRLTKAGSKLGNRFFGRASVAARGRGSQWAGSVGAGKWTPRILQTGDRTIREGTAKALNEFGDTTLKRREWGRALELLKRENQLRNDFHGKIGENGDYMDKAGNVIDNLFDYIPGG